jgi:hypothetical protein
MSIVVKLRAQTAWQLQEIAANAGMQPWELASIWVEEALERTSHLQSEAVRRELEDLDTFLRDYRTAVDRATTRLDKLEALATQLERSLKTIGGSQAPRLIKEPVGEPGVTPKLHEEIVAVLQERGQSMTTGEIAAAVTSRGRYQPRDGKPTDAARIAGRIANPRYRSLFARNGRSVSLAGDSST